MQTLVHFTKKNVSNFKDLPFDASKTRPFQKGKITVKYVIALHSVTV